jgi:predicted N-acetyltransferase YhbS
MAIKIRLEAKHDQPVVENVVRLAFENAEHTNHKEYILVHELRNASSFIPELSLIAITDKEIVGYILFSRISIEEEAKNHIALALAPLAVLPEYQKRGTGSLLVEKGHKEAYKLGYDACIVLGNNKYYSRFGYRESKEYGIYAPFQVHSENFMVRELKKDSLKTIRRIVKYPKEFEI